MERKRLRLPDYGYNQAGVYFLTLCAKEKQPLFGKCVGGGVHDAPQVKLSDAGVIVQARLEEMDRHYEHLSLKKYIIMPNHVHILVEVIGPSGTPAPTKANQAIPAYVSTLKRLTNRTCERELWHRGYYDHVIRSEADFLRIWTYIDENPAKWADDEYFVR